MHFLTQKYLKLFFACLILFHLSSHQSFAQSNADYLKLLEGEASNSTVDEQTQANKKKPAKVNRITALSDGKIPTGLSIEDFMQNLKVNYIGTYFFAKRLSENQKNNIYIFYQNNNDPQAIRTEIIKISKKN